MCLALQTTETIIGGGGEGGEGMNPSRTPLTRTLRGSRKWFDKVGVRYIVEVYWGKWNQREIQTIRYSGGSLYPVFDIAEFDCMTFQTWRYCFSKREWICPEWGGGKFHSITDRQFVCSLYLHNMFTVCSQYFHNIFTVCSLYVHYIFTMSKQVLLSVFFPAFWRAKYRNTNKNISWYSKRMHLVIYL